MTVVFGRLLLCSDRALTERRGHNFLSLKAWSCGQVVCLWDSICPGEAGEHLFQICTLMIYKRIVSLNEFIFFFTLFFPKICMLHQFKFGDFNYSLTSTPHFSPYLVSFWVLLKGTLYTFFCCSSFTPVKEMGHNSLRAKH